MNTVTKDILGTWDKSKLVDTLWTYIQTENKRLAKQRDYHKQYNAKRQAELEEFKAWKASK